MSESEVLLRKALVNKALRSIVTINLVKQDDAGLTTSGNNTYYLGMALICPTHGEPGEKLDYAENKG